MTQFCVTLTRTSHQSCDYTVEADTEEAAEKLAIERAEAGEIADKEWTLDDSEDYEVVEVESLDPPEDPEDPEESEELEEDLDDGEEPEPEEEDKP